jgi:catechol 2,3-dioxygenase-like lactoylglutathione lyase family enzyme
VTEPLIRKLDHVFVPVRDPAPPFALFTETLGLPVAWPVTNKGPFTSAAVCAGNANIEFITSTAPSSFSSFLEPTEPLTVRGLAFEPADGERMEDMLEERRLPNTGAQPFARADGELMWTNVFLDGMLADAAVVFLCDYHGATAEDRAAVRGSFGASGGGVLGVRRVAEVTLGVRNLDDANEKWRRFLAPTEPDTHGAFHVGDGPTIRLKASPIEGVAGLWLEVESLAKARDTLRERDLLGPMRASGIGLDYARNGGLDVWLTEPR